MSLRLRSIAAAAIATLIAVAVLGSAVDVLVARHLRHELDHTLRARAVEVAQLSASAPALLTTPGSLDSPVGATQAMVEVVDRRDRIVARSLSLGGRVLPRTVARAAIALGTSRYRSLEAGDESLRLYAAPLAESAGPAAGGAVIVAASTSSLDDTIRSIHALTLLSAVAAALVGAAAVAFLMRRALQPLARLDRAAAEIERTGDSRRRLPDPGRADEVGRLATTLNAMLSSLERAREAERRFLADASHELRTPLTALRGNVAYLARHGATPALVADLEADAERLARLADDLLALSREEAAPPPGDQVRLDELALTFAAPDVEIEARPVTVRGDRPALERALANLVENARRHGPAGGPIAVRIESSDGLARLRVTDTGPGVSAADRDRVFERFWRGRSDTPGSGVGLAIVRATAERHGGRAYVDGSRFTIELPLLRRPSESPATPSGGHLEKGSP
jgi:two-component system OmpR family sensor kinase